MERKSKTIEKTKKTRPNPRNRIDNFCTHEKCLVYAIKNIHL